MTDTSLFNEKDNTTEPTSSEVSTNPAPAPENANVFDDRLKTITTDGGQPKYETVDKALDALVNAQTHIPKIERENAELRKHLTEMMEKVEKADELGDIVSRLNATSPEESAPQNPSLSVDDLSDQVNQILDKRSQVDHLQRNEMEVSGHMREKFGDKALEVINSKAADMGVTVEYLQNTARTSPRMFMSLFGESMKKEPQVTTSSVNTAAMPQTTHTPPRSLMAGASTKDLIHEMAQLKADVLKKYEL